MSTRASIAIVAAFLAVAGSGSSPAQEPDPAPSVELTRFLLQDCGSGEEEVSLHTLPADREAVEEELGRLLRDGPDGTAIAGIRTVAEERWARLEAFLETDPHLGLDPQARLDVVTLTREAFVARAVERFVRSQQEKAVIGLAAIGSPSALRSLREVRESADDELGGFIDLALHRHGSTSRGTDPTRRRRPAGSTAAGGPRRPVRD